MYSTHYDGWGHTPMGVGLILWIDTICIDQSNLAERSHRVAMMSHIYSQCAHAIVWLGDFDRDTPPSKEVWVPDDVYTVPSREPHLVGCECQDTLWENSVNIPRTGTPNQASAMATTVFIRLVEVDSCENFQLCRMSMNQEEMVAFRFFMKYLLANPWLTRTWVVQEYAHPPEVLVFFGWTMMPLDMISEVSSIWQSHVMRGCCAIRLQNLRQELGPLSLQFFSLESVRKICRSKNPVNILLLRSTLTGKLATLDHDHLYGFFGLIQANSVFTLTPKYDLPVEEAYMGFTRSYMNTENLCDCGSLVALALAFVKLRYPGLPSWAIDFTMFERAEHEGLTAFTNILFH
jgi:hypothetical protein